MEDVFVLWTTYGHFNTPRHIGAFRDLDDLLDAARHHANDPLPKFEKHDNACFIWMEKDLWYERVGLR